MANLVGPSGSLRDPWLVSSTDRPSGVLSLGATGGFPSGVLSLGTTGGLFNMPCRAWGDLAPCRFCGMWGSLVSSADRVSFPFIPP